MRNKTDQIKLKGGQIFNIRKSVLDKDVISARKKIYLIEMNKADNFVRNRIAAYNKAKIKYDGSFDNSMLRIVVRGDV